MAWIKHNVWWLASAGVVAITGITLLLMGRPPYCSCGTIRIWVGDVNSRHTSQHLMDWYTPSHMIHGMIFLGLGGCIATGIGRLSASASRPSRPPFAASRWSLLFFAAVVIEAAWEIVENSPWVINRYREATAAAGYTGDSVWNSLTDIGWMGLGFLIAYRLGLWWSLGIAVVFELLALWAVRDNLTLNVLMLVWPVEAVRVWQGGG